VTTGSQRDSEELRDGIERWVSAHGDLVPGLGSGGGGVGGAGAGAGPGGSALHVTKVDHADGGMANETVMVELGPDHPGVVLRLPPIEATFPDYDLSTQATVQNAVASAGIPAPAPTAFVSDTQWIGTAFLIMPRVSGFIPGAAPVFDQAITGATPARQEKIHDGLFDTLVALHAVDWAARGLGPILPGPTLDDALRYWTRYVEWAGEGTPLPVLVDALAWCRQRQPDSAGSNSGPALLWGDARLGNLVFDDGGNVHAVLDWDLASIGPPEMDLGWYFGLDRMMEALFGQTVEGFPSKAVAVQRYQERSGHEVTDLDWYEVFAMTRALAVNDRHQRIGAAQRHGAGGTAVGGRPDRRTENPMIGVLRGFMEGA
jgi:aminoglycoside phosphotransferase (APT) family kinase protein